WQTSAYAFAGRGQLTEATPNLGKHAKSFGTACVPAIVTASKINNALVRDQFPAALDKGVETLKSIKEPEHHEPSANPWAAAHGGRVGYLAIRSINSLAPPISVLSSISGAKAVPYSFFSAGFSAASSPLRRSAVPRMSPSVAPESEEPYWAMAS